MCDASKTCSGGDDIALVRSDGRFLCRRPTDEKVRDLGPEFGSWISFQKPYGGIRPSSLSQINYQIKSVELFRDLPAFSSRLNPGPFTDRPKNIHLECDR